MGQKVDIMIGNLIDFIKLKQELIGNFYFKRQIIDKKQDMFKKYELYLLYFKLISMPN